MLRLISGWLWDLVVVLFSNQVSYAGMVQVDPDIRPAVRRRLPKWHRARAPPL